VTNINIYLADSPVSAIAKHYTPVVAELPLMLKGSQPTDGQNLIIEPEDLAAVQEDPIAARYVRRLIGGETMLHGGLRHCLWLVDMMPSDAAASKVLSTRLAAVAQMRRESPTTSVQAAAKTPGLFTQIRQPKQRWLAMPRVSSENRDYVPMAFFGSDDCSHDTLLFVDGATDYLFGLLQSRPFNVWAKAVSGRLKSDIRLSPDLSYNSFPAPEPTSAQRAQITAAAQEVLRVRNTHPGSSLADLYDPLATPPDLVKAHANLDKVVLASLGLAPSASDGEILGALFKRYGELVAPMASLMEKKKRKKGE
jgi:hypothetical protein